MLFLLLATASGSYDAEPWLERVESVQPWWLTTRCNRSSDSIIFVKTHKTAGSTVSSILHRYCAEMGNVSCYVPHAPGGTVTRPSLSNRSLHLYNPGEHVSVHAQHTSYWPNFLHRLVPSPAPIVTIVRHPVSRFLSSWEYHKFKWRRWSNIFDIVRKLPKEREKLPSDFRYYVEHESLHKELCPHQPEWAVSNSSEPSCIQTLRDMISGRLALILLTERLDEGLVLLSRMMGWSLRTVVYSSMKVSNTHSRHNSPESDVAASIERWLPEDMLLYRVAAALLNRRIESQDESFQQELREFHKLKALAQHDCSSGNHRQFDALTCSRMHQDNVAWVKQAHNRLKRHMRPR